jgi:hypothetical protein
MKIKIAFVLFVMLIIAFNYSCEKEDQTGTDFSGKLTTHSTCKSFKTTNTESGIPDTLSCVEFTFEGADNKLLIKHINAGFNCCPESLYCDIVLENDTIFIHEHEKDGMCDCLCLFDLNIEITGVEAKKYQVKFIEPYAIDQEKLDFEADLKNNPTASVCVTRKKYPWGVFNLQ